MDQEMGKETELETRKWREMGKETELETRNGRKCETRHIIFQEKTRKNREKQGGKD